MTGLSRAQVTELREKHHIYLLPSGRLSVTGCKSPTPRIFRHIYLSLTLFTLVTQDNVNTVAAAFQAILGTD